MSIGTDKLSDARLRALKTPSQTPSGPQKHSDGGGLFALHTTAGALIWKLKFRIGGAEQLLTFGSYPDVSLAAARALRDDARALIAQGLDPREVKAAKIAAAAPMIAPDLTFRRFALDLMAELAPTQKPTTVDKWQGQLGGYAVGQFGDRQIAAIKAKEVRGWLVDTFQATGRLHTMHEILHKMAATFARAAYEEVIPANPLDIRAIKAMRLAPAKDKGHPAITKDPARFADLLRCIDGHRGDPSVRAALQFIALTAQRPHMIRFARWEQINWVDKAWEIDAGDMKGTEAVRRDHMVPLSDQALAVLKFMEPISGGVDRDGKPRVLIFPGRSSDAPMSDATMNKAMRDMGFCDHVGHGFRASFNTFLKERLGYKGDQDLIDLCLAHVVGNAVQRAYDRSDLIADRRALFQRWADWLDQLRAPPATVVRIDRAA